MQNINLETIHNLKWHPFIGSNYFNNPEENKMLIIGESHYSYDTEKSKLTVNDIDFTKDMIQQNAIEGGDWGTKIITNFHKAMFGDNSFDSEKFWNLVSYYNFIQRPMLTIEERPNEKDFADGWKTFFDLIKIIKPKICIFIGVSASNYFMSELQQSDFSSKGIIVEEMINNTYSRKSTLTNNKNYETKILFIKHSSQYFSWNKWNEYLKKEVGNQLSWFEKNIDIGKQKIEPNETKILKVKLSKIYKLISKKEFESIVDSIEFVPPPKSGNDSDCFTLKYYINKYSFIYEIVIDDFGFCSYHYDIKSKKPIHLLTEKGIEALFHNENKTAKEIASEITEEILKIISILKEDTK